MFHNGFARLILNTKYLYYFTIPSIKKISSESIML